MSYQPPSTKKSNTGLWIGGAVILLVALIAVLVLLLNHQPAPAAPASAVIVSAASATAEPVVATPTAVDTSMPVPADTPTSTPMPELGTSNLFIEYILDASGSMSETLSDGSPKIEVAQRVLTEHMRSFRPETNIGLRVYGHRLPYQQTDESCQDIELIAPPEKGQMERIVGWLQNFMVQGMTPLAASLELAKDDFVYDASRVNSIVMLSDGIETCGGDPCQLVEDLKTEGINFTIHVIGLDVDDPTRQQLTCIAQAGGGMYHDARSQEDLDAALGAVKEDVTRDEVVVPPGVNTPTPILTPTDVPIAESSISESLWSGKIAFLSDRSHPRQDGGVGSSEIYVVDPDGGTPFQITDDLRIPGLGPFIGFEDRFTWSPVLKRFFYSLMSGELFSVGEDGSDLMSHGSEFVIFFDVSPDGKTIAFTTWREKPNVDVATMDVDGTNMTYVLDEATRRRLGLTGESSGNGPSWSPDGSRIAVNTSASGGLMIIDMASKSVVLPIQPPMWVMEPLSWSPDGRYLFVQQTQPGSDSRKLRYIDLVDGSIITLPIEGYDPEWSPDGSKIVYLDNDHQQLWIANADGSEPRQLTFEGSNCCAEWIP